MHGLSVKRETLLPTNSDVDVEIEAEDEEWRKESPSSAGEVKREGEPVITDPTASKWEPCEMIAWLSPKKNTQQGHRLSSSPPAVSILTVSPHPLVLTDFSVMHSNC